MTKTMVRAKTSKDQTGRALLGIAAYIIESMRNQYIKPGSVLMYVSHDVAALAFPERGSTPRTLRYAEKAKVLIAAPKLLAALLELESDIVRGPAGSDAVRRLAIIRAAIAEAEVG